VRPAVPLPSGRPDYPEYVKAEAVRLVGQGVHPSEARRRIFERFGCMPDQGTIRAWAERGGRS
jgi:hypothetical protein